MVGWSVEAGLVAAARGGRQEALDELVGQSLPLVYNIVGRALSGRADVDDVVQETMLRVLRGLPDLRDDSAYRSWLAAVTMNQIRRHTQARANAPHTHERALDELAAVADPGADFEDLTLTQLGLSGQRRETVEATRWLDQDDRELLSLWWLVTAGHLTRTELAGALGLDPHHVTVRVGRMKAQLEGARLVVRALAAQPGCPELARTVHLWDGRPSALWRKRLARHMRECGRCGALGADLVPPERLLVGLALIPLPVGYLGWLLSRVGAGDHLAAAADALPWHPDQAPDSHATTHPSVPAHQATWASQEPHGPHGPQGPQGPHVPQTPQGPHLPQEPQAPRIPGQRRPTSHRRAVGGHGRFGPFAGKPLLLAAAATATVTAAVGAGALLLGGGGSPGAPAGLAAATGTRTHSAAAQPVSVASSAAPSPTRSPSASASASPSPSATPSATTVPPSPDQAAAEQVLTVINQARAQQGLAPLQLSTGLGSSSTAHNQRMATGCGLSHDCPGEAQLGSRESAAGVQWSNAGENIGTGGPVSDTTSGIAGMAVGLTRSMLAEQPPDDGHRKNILSPDFHHVGIAVMRDSSGNVWLTQDFSN
ncbi:RNA polymerase sigma factor, sigma-70 family [Streptacidiphilus jiangxiensis]|uniref:RNA polymerase sigma factor n=3 Tax=Streptacidiphilus jiangxiensis TaxID=235985 RepID=A0A1H7WPV2_STRJI|nr:RNA polymerase sigma factor, sigma-70 family [Streptacidiphilus jiangxiensis]